jgi:hypothetical protein
VIYSTQFAAGALTGGVTTDLFLVPSGHVYVVVDIVLVRTSVGDPDWVRIYQNSAGNPFILSASTMAQNDALHQYGRQVIAAGRTVRIRADTHDYRWVISGYDLLT